jgi:hypothetical protein
MQTQSSSNDSIVYDELDDTNEESTSRHMIRILETLFEISLRSIGVLFVESENKNEENMFV